MPLTFLPCSDSAEAALAWKVSLDIPRGQARQLGESAVAIIAQGSYEGPSGVLVSIKDALAASIAARQSLPPDAVLPPYPAATHPSTTVSVANTSTLAGAQLLQAEGHRPLVLNFANGVQPGGGFLNGAKAQEEVICRSSGLYATLRGDPMYEFHRARPLPDSSAWCILSPAVPVFRNDPGEPLPSLWLLNVITCAAPYAPTIGQEIASQLLRDRIHRVLAVARAFGFESLVLGAWGCGAFANDPAQTARDFRDALEGPFAGSFSRVLFAITDWSPERRFLGPFRDVMR